MKKLLLGFLLLTSCGSPYTIDPDVLPYVQSFEKEFGVKVEFSIDLAPLNNGLSGVCYRGEKYRHITIDKSYWDHASILAKEETVYHELGHCVFNFEHIDNYVNIDGVVIPGSIMFHGTIGNSWYYLYYHKEYLEAFKRNTVILK